MTAMTAGRAWTVLIGVALIAASCERKPPPAPAPKPAVPAPAAAPAALPPLSFRQNTPDAEVALTLPAAVAKVPALYTKLYSDGRNSLRAFADGAKGDLEEQRATGETVRPYRQSLDYRLSAETPRLMGLQVSGREDTGGAEPTNSLRGLIWDKAAGKEIQARDLFARDADLTAADRALCDAIHAAKKARSGDAELNGDLKACPKLTAVPLTLAPSTVAGRAGGLLALFSPFQLGDAGAGYRIAIPLETIRSALAPAYAAEFAGAPAPGAGDAG
ncbi:MAG TPA: DUF3298 domain-containing protein [Caulobacteraceae bacterium]|jgi:hypothetical protein|nr:DUF3298 domain-containing protein [Caulobacteraceae bacterium]